MSKHLLAVLPVGDDVHYLFRDFWRSLPPDTKQELASTCYVGDAEHNLKCLGLLVDYGVDKFESRHFLLCRTPNFDGINTRYFEETDKSALLEIGTLRVKTTYIDRKWETCSIYSDSDVEDSLEEYERLERETPRKLLVDGIKNSNSVREHLTRKKWFSKDKRVLKSGSIAVSLEVPFFNGVRRIIGSDHPPYVLSKTGPDKTYTGIITVPEKLSA